MDTAVATIKNTGEISLAIMQSMAKTAGTPVQLNADSMSADGKSVEARISLAPTQATKSLNLSASTTNAYHSLRWWKHHHKQWPIAKEII